MAEHGIERRLGMQPGVHHAAWLLVDLALIERALKLPGTVRIAAFREDSVFPSWAIELLIEGDAMPPLKEDGTAVQVTAIVHQEQTRYEWTPR